MDYNKFIFKNVNITETSRRKNVKIHVQKYKTKNKKEFYIYISKQVLNILKKSDKFRQRANFCEIEKRIYCIWENRTTSDKLNRKEKKLIESRDVLALKT